jgi:hypothetical protein
MVKDKGDDRFERSPVEAKTKSLMGSHLPPKEKELDSGLVAFDFGDAVASDWGTARKWSRIDGSLS